MPSTPLVYLASPIDLSATADAAEVSRMRGNIAAALQKSGMVTYNPADAFVVGQRVRPSGVISEINNSVLARCDGVLALFPEYRTIGVSMEIARAQMQGKPVVVVSGAIEKSWALQGNIWTELFPPTEDAGAVVQTLQDMIANHRYETGGVALLPQAPEPTLLPMVLETDSLTKGHSYGLGRGYPSDAGFDLHCSTDMLVAPNTTVDVPCGVSLGFPEGVWGMIVGRSSTLRKHNLLVNLGVIDTGYRGPLFANIRNMNGAHFQVTRGMRLAQIIPLPNLASGMKPFAVNQLEDSDRGTAGFGSSGV